MFKVDGIPKLLFKWLLDPESTYKMSSVADVSCILATPNAYGSSFVNS